MIQRSDIQPAVQAAIPIMLGYVAIGIPCGILEDSIGMNALQVFFLSCMFYSGAGQFMIQHVAGGKPPGLHHRQRVAREHASDAIFGVFRAHVRQ